MPFAEESHPEPTPAYTLFDANAVSLATFLGTPVAGASLMALNDRRLGRAGRAVTTLVLAVAVTALVILLGWNIPQGFSAPIAIALVVAMRYIALSLQGAAVKDHLQRGGRLGSKWTAFGVGMAFLIAFFAVVFLVLFIPTYTANKGPKVVIGSKDEVFYSGSATKDDAQTLGNALKTTGYFADKGVAVLLEKGNNGTVVSFVVKDGIWDQPEMVSSFEEMGREVARSVGGFPIKLHLVTDTRDVKEESIVGREVFAGKDHVYYLGAATESQAQALGQALQSADYFHGKGADVFLSRHSDGAVLSFVVGDGAWDNPALVADFEKIVRQAAPTVGGLPIRLRLLNTSIEVKKDEVLK